MTRSSLASWLTCSALALGPAALADTFTVTELAANAPGGLRTILNQLPAPGPHRVVFNLPGPGPHEIQLDGIGLSLLTEVEIDGTSQPGAIQNTSLTGWNAQLPIVLRNQGGFPGPAPVGLFTSVTLRGLVLDMPNTELWVNHLPTKRVVITGCSVSVVQVTADQASGLRLGGPTPAERNLVMPAPMYFFGAPNALIEGNYFVSTSAVALSGFADFAAIAIREHNPGLEVRNNVFQELAWEAIRVEEDAGPASPVVVGNRFVGNNGLAIDVEPLGPTPNDPGDTSLPVNHPELDVRQFGPTEGMVGGALDGAPNTLHTVEIYSSPRCDPSGFGEGEVSLGTLQVTTDATGAARFTFSVPTDQRGRVFTALATSPRGTSEFGPCLAPTGALEVPTLSAWALALLGATLAGVGASALARQRG